MIWYLLVAVVLGGGGLLLRRRLVAGPPDLDPAGLTGAEVGYLVGGPRRAVAAVLGGLRIGGAIGFHDGRVVRLGPAPDTWGRLGPLVRIAATGRPGIQGLLHRRAVADALHPVRRDLTEQGWLLSDGQRSTVRRIAVPMWVLAAVGVLMIVRAEMGDRPVGWLFVATGAVIYWAVPLSTAPELTTNARRALGRFAEANEHLSPAASPSLLTYGPAAAALAVGLFGTNVLLPIDSDLALAADRIDLEPSTARETAGPGSGGGGGEGGGGGGGGSGCGAGSSGSGGSGGSSCGGGSGCGGGCGGCGG